MREEEDEKTGRLFGDAFDRLYFQLRAEYV
jgi:hypothetical protein